ncbi:substrate adhesion molecule [Heterostelium album PN500]|uniref:Substrate adhesion molecule n=1 Tax=Heterostelium pallidum (strain ATCC 26659 / Pp 5 / PN500) TaxID=670386 RepID=D3BTE1_HETP5|nr:substrate adhesion molecule [Heterostelium album PN500]EFA75358.1 substrate adhesion molecule [Heterostelium album PN500]|eukprot:XP_020427492.1 substrate adhesion molecule [Heterostelium album PN500]
MSNYLKHIQLLFAFRASFFYPTPSVNSTLSYGYITIYESFDKFVSCGSSCSLKSIYTNFIVNNVEKATDWVTAEMILYQTFPNNGTRYVNYYDNARLSNLANNADGDWNVGTEIALSANGGSSPASGLLPIMNSYVGILKQWQVPVADLTPRAQFAFELASYDLMRGVQPTGMSISTNGLVSFNATQTGMWSAQFKISKYVDSNFISSVVIDFLVNSTMPPANLPKPPVFIAPTPDENKVVAINATTASTFTIVGKAFKTTSSVTISIGNVPEGMVVGQQVDNPTNVGTIILSWTPTSSQVGVFVISLGLVDSDGNQLAQGVYSFYIEIRIPTCGNGVPDTVNGGCICNTGWAGPSCTECDNGYYGPYCKPNPPCEHGTVNSGINGDGACICDQGWMGETCNSSLSQRCDPTAPSYIVNQINSPSKLVQPSIAQIYLNKDTNSPVKVGLNISSLATAPTDIYFVVDVSSASSINSKYLKFQSAYRDFEINAGFENIKYGLGYYSDSVGQPNTFQLKALLKPSIWDEIQLLEFKVGAPQANFQYQALSQAISNVQWSATGSVRIMILVTDNDITPTDFTLIPKLQVLLAKHNILLGVYCMSTVNSYFWLTPDLGMSSAWLTTDLFWYSKMLSNIIKPMKTVPQTTVSGDIIYISNGPNRITNEYFETTFSYVQPQNPTRVQTATLNVVGFGSQSVQIHYNHAPVTTSSNLTLLENSNVVFNIPASDEDGNILLIKFNTIPTQGVLFMNGSQVFSGILYQLPSVQSNLFNYVPNHFSYGVDQLTYTVDDGCASVDGLVNFTITYVNVAPVCNSTTIKTDQYTEYLFPIQSVDLNSDVVTISFKGLSLLSTIGSIFAPGNIPVDEGLQYPNNTYFQFVPIQSAPSTTVSIQVYVTDTKLTSQCSINIQIVRKAVIPTININTNQIMRPDSRLYIPFTVSDPDPNEVVVISLYSIQLTKGTFYDSNNVPITGNSYTLGTYTMTSQSTTISSTISYQSANENYADTSFTIGVDDSSGLSASTSVSILVNGIISPYPPVAQQIAQLTVAQNSVTSVFVLNGSHPQQPSYAGGFKISFLSSPQHGTILRSNGNTIPSVLPTPFSFTYKPVSNYFGEDQFSYYVKDDSGLPSSPVTVAINVTKVDYAPVISINPSQIVTSNTCPSSPQSVNISLTINNINPMTNLRVTVIHPPTIGTLFSDGQPITTPSLIDPTKPLQYHPSVNGYENYDETYEIQACDVLCSSIVGRVNSESIPTKPTGEGKSLVTIQNQQVSFTLVGNDCQDSANVKYQFSSLPKFGVLFDASGLTINSTDQIFKSNSFTYSPNKDESDLNSIGGKGPLESFSYFVINKHSIGSITYPIDISVNPIPMFIGERNLTTHENVKLTIPIKATAPEGDRYVMNITSFTGNGQLYYFKNGNSQINISSTGLVLDEQSYVLYYMPPNNTYGVNVDSFQFAIKQRYSSEIYTIYIDVIHVFRAPRLVPLTYTFNGTVLPIINNNVELHVNTSSIITFNVTSDDHPWTELKSTFGSGLTTGGVVCQYDSSVENGCGSILTFNTEIKRSANDNLWRVVYIPTKGRSGLKLSQFTLIGTDPLNMTQSERLFMSVIRINIPPVVNVNQLQYNTTVSIPISLSNITVFDPDSDKNNITFTLSLQESSTNQLTQNGSIVMPFASPSACNISSNQITCLDTNPVLNMYLNTLSLTLNNTGSYQLIVYVNDLGYNAMNRSQYILSDSKTIAIIVSPSQSGGGKKSNTVILSAAIAAAAVAAALIALGVWRILKSRAPPTDSFFGESPFSEGSVSTNPLYKESPNSGFNPLYDNNHA